MNTLLKKAMRADCKIEYNLLVAVSVHTKSENKADTVQLSKHAHPNMLNFKIYYSLQILFLM